MGIHQTVFHIRLDASAINENILIVVNKDRQLTDITLAQLGYYSQEEFTDKLYQTFKSYVYDLIERAEYIIFGLPKNCIEGILVGRQVEQNDKRLETLKKLFPNSYICNLDGVVIR